MEMLKFSRLVLLLFLPLVSLPACSSPSLDQELSQIFVGRSFTIRNFYRGGHLRYGSDGQLLEKAEPGFWSRDGMVQFTAVKLSRADTLIMQGNRYCIQFEPEYGEFVNVRTGDKVEIEIQLKPDQLSREALVPVMQKILLSSRDRLSDLVPSYWSNCLSRKVSRRDKHSPWECEATDKQILPEFVDKTLSWDLPPPDNSLHNGTRHYLLQHRVAYLLEPGLQVPTLLGGPNPFFDWLQERTKVGEMTLVLAFTVGEDGKAHDIFIVSPIGMGLDDEAAQAVSGWNFKPGRCGSRPCAVHARVYFDIRPTTTVMGHVFGMERMVTGKPGLTELQRREISISKVIPEYPAFKR